MGVSIKETSVLLLMSFSLQVRPYKTKTKCIAEDQKLFIDY